VPIPVAKRKKERKENQSTKKEERSCAEIKTLVVGLTWFLFSFI
jgi:hypothetical protein